MTTTAPSTPPLTTAADGLFVVGLGGSTRPESSTERVIRAVLDRLAERGAETALYAGRRLVLPFYEQAGDADASADLVADVRRADAVVIGSPAYHGSLSGVVKNALDHLEALRDDERPYLEGRAVGCVTTAYGWQAAVNTLTALRQIVHSLRGWPTPYGIALNVSGGLFSDDGSLPPDVDTTVGLMADQIVTFASAMRAAPR